MEKLTQADFKEGEWEILAFICEDCEAYSEGREKELGEPCEECGGEDVMPQWNYEGEECMLCEEIIEVHTEIFYKEDGKFEEVICSSCHDDLD